MLSIWKRNVDIAPGGGGDGVAGWQPGGAMPWLISPLAVIHLIRVRRHTRSEWHARSHAVRTLLGPAGRAPPSTYRHLAASQWPRWRRYGGGGGGRKTSSHWHSSFSSLLWYRLLCATVCYIPAPFALPPCRRLCTRRNLTGFSRFYSIVCLYKPKMFTY